MCCFVIQRGGKMSYAVVLGVSTGVGAAIARRLARAGHGVLGFHRGRHAAEAAETKSYIQTLGQDAQFFTGDAGRSVEAVDAGVRAVCAGVPPASVSVFVHSLSGASPGDVLTLTPERIERTFNVMAHSFLYWVRALYQERRLAPGAHLIALSNPCSGFYLRNSGVIGAAKAALESYVRTLAAELGPVGHFVNAVTFSTVVTPALRQVLSPEAIAALETVHANIVPGGRLQTATDVAEIVARLVQDQWTNGAVLDHTGGSPMMLMDFAFNGAR